MAKHPTKYFLDSPQLFPIQNTLLVTTSARHPHLAAIVRLSPSNRRATRCIIALLFALLLPYTLWATTPLSNSKSASTNSAIEFIHTFPTDTATPNRSASPKLNSPDFLPHLNYASTNHPTLYNHNNTSHTLQEVEKGSESHMILCHSSHPVSTVRCSSQTHPNQ